jgi:hypothetical protein
MKLKFPSIGVAALALAAAGAVALFPSPGQASDPLNRYPYDPVCPWGRIANGRGVIVRCLNQAEATDLAHRAASPAGISTPMPPSFDGGVPDALPTGMAAEVRGLKVNADVGKLPEAEKKLSAAKDRYVDCVAKNGGLEESRGEVQVRFLVRARGRAEGVSVVKKSGLGSQAAQCIAEVVDRRQVGVPEEPIVGATVIIQFAAH